MGLLAFIGGNVLFWAVIIMIAKVVMENHDVRPEVHDAVMVILVVLAVVGMIAAGLLDLWLFNTGQNPY